MKYFKLEEFIKSDSATRYKIDNTPSAQEKNNIIALVDNILDPLREAYKKPIIVTSGFRCKTLNDAIKGSKTSQHMKGQAADIRSVEDTIEENKKIFELIQKLNLPYDQLIDEYNYNWIHVSYAPSNRKQILHIK